MESELKPSNKVGPVEITDDLSTIKVIINEMVSALNKGRKSRERSLVATKLQEARMWCEEAQANE